MKYVKAFYTELTEFGEGKVLELKDDYIVNSDKFYENVIYRLTDPGITVVDVERLVKESIESGYISKAEAHLPSKTTNTFSMIISDEARKIINNKSN